MFYLLFFYTLLVTDSVTCLCGSNFIWAHSFNMDFVYGKWYGVGYAKHSPLSYGEKAIECVTLFIKDVTTESKIDWLNWNVLTIPRRNYTGQSWHAYRDNLRTSSSLSRSWRNAHLSRTKRNMYEERHVQIMWDAEGGTVDQVYVYSPEDPGLWTAEDWEQRSRGIDVHHPDDPPRQAEVVKIIKVTTELLIINHCSDSDENSITTLVFRRVPAHVDGWQEYELERELIDLELPTIYRKSTVCGSCANLSSGLLISFIFLANMFRWYV